MKETMFASFDGMKLYLTENVVENERAAIIIVHGLCEHLGRYEYVTKRLNEAGYSVYRFDHRGHGKSEGKRVYYDTFTEISDDVNAVFQYVKTSANRRVYVLGHSMGGYATSCFASRYPNQADGIILSGAVTRYYTKCAGELPVAAPLDTYFPNGLGDGVCSDPAVVEAYGKDPLVEKAIAVGLLNSLYDGVEWLKKHPKAFVEPVLILHGCNDGLVSIQDSCEFYQEIASTDKTLKIYSKLCHEIFNEVTKDDVIDDVIFWLAQHIQ